MGGACKTVLSLLAQPPGASPTAGALFSRGCAALQTAHCALSAAPCPARIPESRKAMMAAKPKLHYPNGRGRMESVRWVLAAAGVEFDEEFLETKEQLQRLQDGEYGDETTVGDTDFVS